MSVLANIITSNFFPLGLITPQPGFPEDLLVNLPALREESFSASLILFQADWENAGRVFIGTEGLHAPSRKGVIYVLMGAGDAFSINAGYSAELGRYRVDVESPGDGVLVSVYVR